MLGESKRKRKKRALISKTKTKTSRTPILLLHFQGHVPVIRIQQIYSTIIPNDNKY